MTRLNDYGWGSGRQGSVGTVGAAVLSSLKDLKAGRVLDVGCGNGELASVLSDAGFDIFGVDGDPRGIEIAKERSPHITFDVVDFGDPAPSGFDAVVTTEVVEHLYSPGDLIRFCREALQPGGHLILTTPYHGYLKNLALSVADAWDEHHHSLKDGGHIKFFSRKSITELLNEYGFKVTSFSGVGRFPYLWKSMIVCARKCPK